MTYPMGVSHINQQISLIKRQVIITAIPENDIGFLFRLPDNGFIVNTGLHDSPTVNMRLIFLHLFDGAVMFLQIFNGGKSLDFLFCQVTIGHRMTNNGHTYTCIGQYFCHSPSRLTFPRSGSDSADCYYRFIRLDHCLLATQELEI